MHGFLYGGGRGYSGYEIWYLSESSVGVVYTRGTCCYQAMSKLIIVKSMVDILYLCVPCNYTDCCTVHFVESL